MLTGLGVTIAIKSLRVVVGRVFIPVGLWLITVVWTAI